MKPPILPGTQVVYQDFVWKVESIPSWNGTIHLIPTYRIFSFPDKIVSLDDVTINYRHDGTCGVLMGWCHREVKRFEHNPEHAVSAYSALEKARPWDGDSVRQAVEEVCRMLSRPESRVIPVKDSRDVVTCT